MKMVTITLLCPSCEREQWVRNGHAPNGKQRAFCHELLEIGVRKPVERYGMLFRQSIVLDRVLSIFGMPLKPSFQRSNIQQWVQKQVKLSLPKRVIQEQSQRYMKGNKPIHRPEMENDFVFTIISHYQGVHRGIVEYYRMAHNVCLLNKLKRIMETSLTKTLAAKLKLSVRKVYERKAQRLDAPERHGRLLHAVLNASFFLLVRQFFC